MSLGKIVNFYVFLVREWRGWRQARNTVVFFCAACLSYAAAVLFRSLYVHPDMHPQAVCLSLFLLKLSSEVSEGLALLIPDTVNEKQALDTGRLTASRAALPPSFHPSFALSLTLHSPHSLNTCSHVCVSTQVAAWLDFLCVTQPEFSEQRRALFLSASSSCFDNECSTILAAEYLWDLRIRNTASCHVHE